MSLQEVPPLNFTDAAAEKVSQLIEQEGNSALNLRVYISGGGCSGFQYGFSFDKKKNKEDRLIQRSGVSVLVDDTSWDLLVGSELHFVEELIGSYFTLKNPNAASTCGCGVSFSVG